MCKHIVNYLERHKLLTTLQHGFRKAHSCESQLLITIDDLITAYDSKVQTDVGILDFSRAFDTVPHERLMGKLAHYGIQEPTNQWIRAFLTNRSMRVVVDGETSDPAPVRSGVPQGTVLGPLLFLVYINDMPNVISEGTFIRLFADDCLVYRRIHSLQDQLTLQEDLNNLHCWATRWGMNFNPSKCHIMQIAWAKPMMKLYEMCGVILASVDRAKYLGVTVSKKGRVGRWPIAPLYARSLNIVPVCGILTSNRTSNHWRRLIDEPQELYTTSHGVTVTSAPLPYSRN